MGAALATFATSLGKIEITLPKFSRQAQVSVIIPKHIRIDKHVRRLELLPAQVEKLYIQYVLLDRDATGLISHNHFLESMEWGRNLMTYGVFELIEVENLGLLSFPEFFDLVCTFGMLEVSEMLKFVMYVLDAEKMGDCDIKETEAYVFNTHGVENANLKLAMEFLRTRDGGDGRVKFKDLLALHRSYPFVFAPAFKMQTDLNRKYLGQTFWERKKLQAADQREELERLERMKRESAAKDIEKEQERQFEEMVKKKMGWKYYGTPWEREKARAKIKKMDALNKQLEAVAKAEALAAKGN